MIMKEPVGKWRERGELDRNDRDILVGSSHLLRQLARDRVHACSQRKDLMAALTTATEPGYLDPRVLEDARDVEHVLRLKYRSLFPRVSAAKRDFAQRRDYGGAWCPDAIRTATIAKTRYVTWADRLGKHKATLCDDAERQWVLRQQDEVQALLLQASRGYRRK